VLEKKIMVSTRRKQMALQDVDEEAEQRRMFFEYREENAKDMQREAGREW
jgi:hypothetical protein